LATYPIPREVRALSVRQPYASHIAKAEKSVEVRSWSTNYRGPLLICASKKPFEEEPVGCAICVVDLVDVRPMIEDDEDKALCDFYDDGAFAWVLERPRPVEHFAVKGRLNIYTVELPENEHARLLTATPVKTPRTKFDWRTAYEGDGGDGDSGILGSLSAVIDVINPFE
jgi:hypothetical protein